MLASTISIPCGSSARVSSSAYVHTPPIGSTVIKILCGLALDVCVFINSIHRCGDFTHPVDFRIECGIDFQPTYPFDGCAPKPIVWWFGQDFSCGAGEMLGNKIVERAVHVMQRS